MIQQGMLIICIFLLPFGVIQGGSLDLHAHLFMKEGLGWIFDGHFNEPIKAKSWKGLLATNANYKTLEESENSVVVISLYAHPVLVAHIKKSKNGVRNSIRRQIKMAYDYVAKNPHWVIARSSKGASKALLEGKKVFILSVEGAHNLLETEKDLKEFIDELGISIVTPIHLINTKFGGAAFMKLPRKTIFTTKWMVRKKRGQKYKLNPIGLRKKGQWLIRELVKRKVWIDLTHSSDRAAKAMIKITKKAGQPILFTHTALRAFYKDERGLGQWAIKKIQQQGGFVGLVPTEEMLVDTVFKEGECPSWCERCRGGVPALAKHFNTLAAQIGYENISIGSDFNGALPHLAPAICPLGTDLDESGLWNMGQYPELWKSMKMAGAKLPKNSTDTTSSFLKQWARVR